MAMGRPVNDFFWEYTKSGSSGIYDGHERRADFDGEDGSMAWRSKLGIAGLGTTLTCFIKSALIGTMGWMNAWKEWRT